MGDFDGFFGAHYDEVVRTLALALGDRGRAEDAAQEAFVKAHNRWDTVRQLDRPVGWVVVVGVNQARRWIARNDRRFRAGPVADPVSVDHSSATVDAAGIRVALAALPPRQRATVVLRYLCDLSTDQVAEALGCAPGTVKSALHAALAGLRVGLATDDPGAPEAEEVDHADR